MFFFWGRYSLSFQWENMSAFSGSNGSCRSPYHERAKKAASKSPGPVSSSSKPRRFVISAPPPTVLRPETAVPRNPGYSDQSPRKGAPP